MNQKHKILQNITGNLRAIRHIPSLKTLFPFIIFLGTTISFHYREVFFGEAYLFSDHIHIMARFFDIYQNSSPWQALQWTENLHFGFSYIREAGGIFFHVPEGVLLLIFEPFTALLVSTLSWFFVSQLFTYYYLRLFSVSRLAAVIGAIMFTFSGSLICQYVHYDFLIVALSTPLLFWAAERLARRFHLSIGFMLTLAMANNFLNSNVQWASYQIPIVIGYYMIRVIQLYGLKKGLSRWLVLAVIIPIVILLVSPYLLPFRDQIAHSVTSQGRAMGSPSVIGEALGGSRWARLWLLFHSLFASQAVGSDVPHTSIPSLVGHSWIWKVYFGISPWFCVAGLWRIRKRAELLPLAGITSLAFLFFVPNFLVPVLPDFRTLYTYIPVWNLFHSYERFLFLGSFSTSILLTFALDAWAQDHGKLARVVPIIIFLSIMGISFCSFLFQSAPEWLPGAIYRALESLSADSEGNYITYTTAGSAMSIFCLLSFLLVASRMWLRLPRYIFLGLLLIILTGELMWYGFPMKPTLNVRQFLSPPPKLAQIIPKGHRFISATMCNSWVWVRDTSPFEARRMLGADMNLFFGLCEIGGYTLPVLTQEEYYVFNLMLADVPLQGPWHRRRIVDARQFEQVLDLWRLYSIEYVLTDLELHHPGFSLLERDGEYRVYKILNSFPRAFCSSRLSVEQSGVIETPGNGVVTSFSGGNTYKEIAVDVQGGGTFLVLTDRWTKEWKATINGNPTKIHKVNGMQQGVFVEEGSHVVRFTYHDIHLIIGVWLAGSTLTVITFIWIGLLVMRSVKNAGGTS